MMHTWGFGGGMGGAFDGHHRFEEQYHCYSVSVADKAHLEKGDKILLPPSAFDTLARLQVDYPMLFKLSAEGNRHTHCGVLEFTAEEGTCYIPFWMMQNLLIEEGAVISVTNVSLPKATAIKLQPQHVDFLEISNPRAVLEHALRNFSCVTKGDIIKLPYNNKNYEFELKDVQPQNAACIIETDCNLDFDAPVGYKEPDYKAMKQAAAASSSSDQRTSACPSPTTVSSASSMTGGVPAENAATTGGGGGRRRTEESSQEDKPHNGIRIVNGKIVQPDDGGKASTTTGPMTSALLAERTGATGVQRNAAIPEQAPEIDYWALQAGDGARLDGKKPAQLKDTEGNLVDVRRLRAEAAVRRAEAAQKAVSMPAEGKTVAGDATSTTPAPPTTTGGSKRKTRVGAKFSRLKQGNQAFKGSANTFK